MKIRERKGRECDERERLEREENMCIRRLPEKVTEKTRESGEMKSGFRGIVERGGIQAMKPHRFGGFFAPPGGLCPRPSAAEMLLQRWSSQ